MGMKQVNNMTAVKCRILRGRSSIVNGKFSIVDQGAFTLIELLVVISVIALLMAVLFPALSRARKQAKAVVCQSRLRQWGMALAMYAEDNQGRFPATQGGVDGFWLLRGAFISDQDPNGPQDSFHHFHTKDIACCPAATQPFGDGHFSAGGTGTSFGLSNFGGFDGTPGSAFGAWEITSPAPAFRGSYGLNQYLFRSFHKLSVTVSTFDLDVLSLRGRADIPVLLDAVTPGTFTFETCPPPATGEGESGGNMQNFCMNRHDAGVNGLFLDWSVRKVGLKELWTLYWYKEFDRAGPWTKAGGVTPDMWPEWMRDMKDY